MAIPSTLLERPLPSAPDAERTLIGGVILENDMADEVIDLLQSEDFYTPSYRYAFDAIVILRREGSEINPVLIGEQLRIAGYLESVGGVSEIANLTYGLPHFTNPTRYIKIVKDKTLLRKLIKTANRIMTEAWEGDREPEYIRARAESLIYTLGDTSKVVGLEHMGVAADEALAVLESMRDNRTNVIGVTSGFKGLDWYTSGWQRSDLILLGGRPGDGKTSFALNLLDHAAKSGDNVVAFFSMEMHRRQIASRRFSFDTEINLRMIRSGYIGESGWNKLHQSRVKLEGHRSFIDHSPGLTAAQIRTRAMRLASKEGRLDLVVVDYIGRMKAVGRFQDRQNEVASISNDLKNLAIELDVPVLALSQLTRAAEDRGKPSLRDLKDSGALEADADVVMFIYRPDRNLPEAELDIAKHRNGPTGSVKFRFEREYTRFVDVDHKAEEPVEMLY